MLLVEWIDQPAAVSTLGWIRLKWPAWPRLFLRALVVAITVVVVGGPDLRHIGWMVPVKPATTRSALVSGGRLSSDAGDGWYLALNIMTEPNSGEGICYEPSFVDFVWDQGDSIVLEWFGADYGLELPKAPRFSSDATPWFLFSDVVYYEAAPCLNDAGQVVFLDVFEPF